MINQENEQVKAILFFTGKRSTILHCLDHSVRSLNKTNCFFYMHAEMFPVKLLHHCFLESSQVVF